MSNHRVRALVILAALLLATPLTAAEELDLDGFIRVLDDLAARTASVTAEDAVALRAGLPAAWRVRAGEDVVEVSVRGISTALFGAERDAAAWPARRQQISARISAMRAEAMARRDGGPPAHGARAGSVLREVLARREFQRSATSIWMERLRDRVAGWLADLFQRLGRHGPNRRTAAIVLAWLVGLSALLVLTWWLVRTISRGQAGARLGLADAHRRRRTSGGWARLALAAHAAGDPREATRCGFHAAVCRLEEEGTWKVDEARTPREYVRLLPVAHRRLPIVADITGQFERIWYGAAAATAEDSRHVLASLKDLGCLASDQAI